MKDVKLNYSSVYMRSKEGVVRPQKGYSRLLQLTALLPQERLKTFNVK